MEDNLHGLNISSNREQTLFNEKYRPDTLEGFVGNETLISSIKKQIEQNDIQNYIFYGKAGSGKTTLAKIIIKNLDCERLYINASDERGIDTIREKIKSFAAMASFYPLKVVVLDEAEFINIAGQAALRNIIEQFSRTTRFILTCNYVERIIDPIQSRCKVIKLEAPSKVDAAKHLCSILDKEKITYDRDSIKNIIQQEYPDFRKMINTIQMFSKSGTLELDKTVTVSSNYISEVIDELKKPNPNFKTIRQIIADSNENTYENLFESIWENASEISDGQEGSIAVILNESAYQANFSLNKEINCMAMINKIINLK